MSRHEGPTGALCQVLSTEMHAYCRDWKCDCVCHLGPYGQSPDRVREGPRRVHSIPRDRWNHMSLRQQEEAARRAGTR